MYAFRHTTEYWLSAATIRGRLLFLWARSKCGYYSRAATIRGAATIRVNTVCDLLWEKVHFRAKIRNCVMHTVRTRVTLALRWRKPCVRSVFLSRVINESVVAPGYALFLETRIKIHARWVEIFLRIPILRILNTCVMWCFAGVLEGLPWIRGAYGRRTVLLKSR